LKQIVASRDAVSDRAGCRLEIIGVVDSASWVWARDGLEDAEIIKTVERKKSQGSIGEERPDGPDILSQVAAESGDIGIMIDVTAAGGMDALVNQALALGLGVVLANKKPLVGPWELTRHLYDNPRIRHEATVGGGLPVIGTLQTLLDGGDEVISIEGQMSGTMSSITSRLDQDVLFSDAIKMARASGVSEPDPRDDLNGWDVMRKVVILGRACGWPLEQSDIEVESLLPPALVNLPLAKFMDSVSELDGSMREWAKTARKAGLVLRYLGQVENGGGSVGLKAIPAPNTMAPNTMAPNTMGQNPMASSMMIAFQTRRYNEEPLYIGSNTSGPETTAAGVLSDMVSLIREW
jgi:homoserine dehydrogenase